MDWQKHRVEHYRQKFALMGRIVVFLAQQGGRIETFDYNPACFGHWTLNFVLREKPYQLSFDGKEFWLGLSRGVPAEKNVTIKSWHEMGQSGYVQEDDAIEQAARELVMKYILD